ncbi:purine-nucleoside phosphorylase [Candidatus Bipolaricaulota bacterium]|nr:purine-nucleoside phosphorylase [Candidatus Bipolaricaulota bacterium]
MSIHIGAKKGDIAPSILLPGDPYRARFIAENLMEDAVCFNEVRGMLGFTGTYRGKRISVMGTGMGVPSHSIYVNELISDYGVKTLVRVGTCGALQPNLELGDVVLAMASSTDSHVNRLRFSGMDYAPTASFDLLLKAYQTATTRGATVRVGNILTSDTFYHDDPESWKLWAAFGVLVVEMETTGLYTLAAKYGVDALSILTVSDSLVSGMQTTSEEREKTFTQMVELALDIVS